MRKAPSHKAVVVPGGQSARQLSCSLQIYLRNGELIAAHGTRASMLWFYNIHKRSMRFSKMEFWNEDGVIEEVQCFGISTNKTINYTKKQSTSKKDRVDKIAAQKRCPALFNKFSL